MSNEIVEAIAKTAHLTRQLDLIPLSVLSTPLTFIGAGGVGTPSILCLAKMGFADITVYDFDKIEVENLSSQFYRRRDIGKFKVDALKEIILDFTDVELQVNNVRYEGKKQFPGIVISSVDSMAVRKLLWDTHLTSTQTRLFIDPRMSAEQALIYAMQPMRPLDVTAYAKTQYTDDNAHQERCTAKATMYTSAGIGALVAKIVKDFVCGTPYARVTEWNIADNILLQHMYVQQPNRSVT